MPSITPYSVPAPSQPFTLNGQTGVTRWNTTFTITIQDGTTYSGTQSVVASGSVDQKIQLNFPFNNLNVKAGSTLKMSVQGYDSNGKAVALRDGSGIGITDGWSNLKNMGFNSTGIAHIIAIDSQGNMVGLPTTYSSTNRDYYFLEGTAETGDDVLFSALQVADKPGSILSQYIAAGQVALLNMANHVQAVGSDGASPPVLVNNQSLGVIGGGNNIGAWTPLAVKSSSDVMVQVHMASPGSGRSFAVEQTATLYADVADQVYYWRLGLGNNAAYPAGQLGKMYFTLMDGVSPVPGLQVSTTPISGGFLDKWVYASAANALNPITFFTGTADQVVVASQANAANFYYINDSIENIQIKGPQLAPLQKSGFLLGATPWTGFSDIPMASSGAHQPVAISDGQGGTVYIRSENTGSWTGEQMHSAVAVKTDSAKNVSIFLDSLATPITTLSNINGYGGFVLPGTLSAGAHTITAKDSSGQVVPVGIVPPGGGYPLSVSAQLKLYVCTASQMPNSLDAVLPDTLYVIQDTGANITDLVDVASASIGVIGALASSGNVAYMPTTPITWAALHQLQQGGGNVSLANIGSVVIADTRAAITDHVYDLSLGQKVAIIDNFANLSDPGMGGTAARMNQDGYVSMWQPGLRSAFESKAIFWDDVIANVLDSAKEATLARLYSGAGANGIALNGVRLSDSVAHFSKLSLPTDISNLTSFMSQVNGKFIFNIVDSFDNLISPTSGIDTIAARLTSATASQSKFGGWQIAICDTAANLEEHFANGLPSNAAALKQFFPNSNPNATGFLGVNFRVQDTDANIRDFLLSPTYSKLIGSVASYTVVDTAENIAVALEKLVDNNWGTPLYMADTIVVKDSFSQVLQNASTLFSRDYSAKVTKVVFTNIAGADANHPIVIPESYSNVGDFPEFDFSQAVGFSGNVTVTKTALSGAQLLGASQGVALTVADSYGHRVVIDLLSTSYITGSIDSQNTIVNCIKLPSSSDAIGISIANLSSRAASPTIDSISVLDSSARISENIDFLSTHLSKVALINSTDNADLVVSTSQIKGDENVLSLMAPGYGLTVRDSTANIMASAFNLRAHLNNINSLRLTDPSAEINLTNQQYIDNASLLGKINNLQQFTIADLSSALSGLNLLPLQSRSVVLNVTAMDGNADIYASDEIATLDLSHISGGYYTTQSIENGTGLEVDVHANGKTYAIYIHGQTLSQLKINGVGSDGKGTGDYELTHAKPITNFSIPVDSVQAIGLSPDGKFLIIKVFGASQIMPLSTDLTFLDYALKASDLGATSGLSNTPVFTSRAANGASEYVLPDDFKGPAALNLQYQLIDSTPNAVVIGGTSNDFIKVASTTSTGKAVNGGGGSDVIDGGVGSTFVSGGTNHTSSTFFLDGRAPGISWSTITDFKTGSDQATIWGFVKGVSSVDTSFTDPNNEGAGGIYSGLTLHFKNLLPDGQATGTNADLNSITLSGRTLADIGVSSLQDLNNQINKATTANDYGQYIVNDHLIIGQTQDAQGTHGYLFVH